MRILSSLFLVLLQWIFASSCFADAPKIGLMGGPSSPAPGIIAEGILCKNLTSTTCVGVSYALSRNELIGEGISLVSQHISAVVDQSLPLGDAYHLFWMQGHLGASYLHRKSKDDDDATKKSQWATSLGVGLGGEFPIADLMGVRVGFAFRKAFVRSAPTEVGLLAGIRFGSEWLGFGQ